MEQEIPERTHGQKQEQVQTKPFYKKTWVRLVALFLALSMIFSIWAGGAIQVSIQRGADMDAATNYLVDHTDYIQQGSFDRLQDVILAFQSASELEDYYRLAGTQIAQEEYAEALVSIEACIELYPGGDEELYVDLLLKRACLLVLLEREDEAITALDRVLERKEDHADAYLIKAQIYAEQEALEPLTQALDQYLTYRPQEYSIRLVYAQALFELQDFTRASQQYELLLQDEANQAEKNELWYLLGLTQLQLSNYTRCEEALEQAKQGDPTLEGLDYYLGICQMSREAYAEAVESFTASIGAGSMLQHCHYSRGVCQLMLGDEFLEAAMEDLSFASAYEGADADPNVKLQADDLLAQLQGVIEAP